MLKKKTIYIGSRNNVGALLANNKDRTEKFNKSGVKKIVIPISYVEFTQVTLNECKNSAKKKCN